MDGIAFHGKIISGRGQYVLPQAIDKFSKKKLISEYDNLLTDGLL